MNPLFEELDYQKTPLGDLSLRRRAEPRLGGDVVYEVKLGEDFLMSSLFTAAEIALARLGLQRLAMPAADVVVGGLGLGYTAAAVLDQTDVRSLRVVEVMPAVIDWHRRGLLPIATRLVDDPRCILAQADFFALATADSGFDPAQPDRRVHAVLLDIDHSPHHWLNPANAAFYSTTGLRCMADKMHPGGVFGLWSNDPPDPGFTARLDEVFTASEACVVRFANPYTGNDASNTVYLARRRG